MIARDQIRKEVMAEIISLMAAATERGEDGWKVVEQSFPGIPSDVVAEAWVHVTNAETEAWWQSVERTIDGEVIRNALKGS